jgi:hypothetical protein
LIEDHLYNKHKTNEGILTEDVLCGCAGDDELKTDDWKPQEERKTSETTNSQTRTEERTKTFPY